MVCCICLMPKKLVNLFHLFIVFAAPMQRSEEDA